MNASSPPTWINREEDLYLRCAEGHRSEVRLVCTGKAHPILGNGPPHPVFILQRSGGWIGRGGSEGLPARFIVMGRSTHDFVGSKKK